MEFAFLILEITPFPCWNNLQLWAFLCNNQSTVINHFDFSQSTFYMDGTCWINTTQKNDILDFDFFVHISYACTYSIYQLHKKVKATPIWFLVRWISSFKKKWEGVKFFFYFCRMDGWIRLIVGFQPLMVISPTASCWCLCTGPVLC